MSDTTKVVVSREKLEQLCDGIYSKHHSAKERGDKYDIAYFGAMLKDVQDMLAAATEVTDFNLYTSPMGTSQQGVDDVEVETYALPRTSGFQPIVMNGIRLHHKPTGITVSCDTERSAHANAAKARELLAKALETSQQQSVSDTVAEPASGERAQLPWQGTHVDPAMRDPSPASQQQCPCGDREASRCPGEWEPGCDLGANEEFARRVDEASQQQAEPASDAFSEATLQKMRAASHLLPDPGGEVARSLLDEVCRLTAELSAAKAKAEALREALKGALAEFDAWGLYGDNSETNSRIDAVRAAIAAQGEKP